MSNETLYRQERDLNQKKDAALLRIRGSEDELRRLTDSPDLSLKNRDARDITERRLSKERQELAAINQEIAALTPQIQAARHHEHLDEIRARRDGYKAQATKHIDRIRELEKLNWEENQAFAKMRLEEIRFQEQFKKELAELRPHAHTVEPGTRFNRRTA